MTRDQHRRLLLEASARGDAWAMETATRAAIRAELRRSAAALMLRLRRRFGRHHAALRFRP